MTSEFGRVWPEILPPPPLAIDLEVGRSEREVEELDEEGPKEIDNVDSESERNDSEFSYDSSEGLDMPEINFSDLEDTL